MIETVRMALQALRGNALRTALSLLGMAIGVFSVIASVTAVSVLDATLAENLSSLGSQTITFTRWTQNGPPVEGEEDRPTLTLAQAERLAARVPLAASVSPSVQAGAVELRTETERTDPDVSLRGVDGDYALNRGLTVAAGRAISEDDVRASRAVVVLGETVRERLFGGREALGQTVRMDGRRYLVVGVLERERGGLGLMDPNNRVLAPVTRVVEAYGLADDDVVIDVRAPRPELVASVRSQATGALRAIRGVAPEADDDFGVTTADAAAAGLSSFTDALALGGAGIGLIALLAAGVGVMNILLVSVTERTREIGLRKALGATRADIRRQFLVEAVVLCQAGGAVGLVLGVLGGNVAAALLKSAPAFPWAWALASVAGVTAVALTFGVVPAVQAARLHPIDALRAE